MVVSAASCGLRQRVGSPSSKHYGLLSFFPVPLLGTGWVRILEAGGGQEGSWSASSVPEGEGGFECPPLSPLWAGVAGWLAVGDSEHGVAFLCFPEICRVWSGASRYIRQQLLQKRVSLVSCLWPIPPLWASGAGRTQSTVPRATRVTRQSSCLCAALPMLPLLAGVFRRWISELGYLHLSERMPQWKRTRFCLLRDLCSSRAGC